MNKISAFFGRFGAKSQQQTKNNPAPKPKKLVLLSIKAERLACLERCAGIKIGDDILHCHHEVFVEKFTEPVENRINYIIASKTDNVALRLRMMRPVMMDARAHKDKAVQKADADWQKAYADRQKAYADWQKADADRQKADADWRKAYADWQKAYLPHYRRLFPESPWDGKTIFAAEFRL